MMRFEITSQAEMVHSESLNQVETSESFKV